MKWLKILGHTLEEIHPDDRDAGDADDLLDAIGDAAGEDGEELGDLEMSVDGPRDAIVDLFSFTRPTSLYVRLMEMPFFMKCESFVICASTAHPSAWLAARTGVQ